jgi:hypothetical protein
MWLHQGHVFVPSAAGPFVPEEINATNRQHHDNANGQANRQPAAATK